MLLRRTHTRQKGRNTNLLQGLHCVLSRLGRSPSRGAQSEAYVYSWQDFCRRNATQTRPLRGIETAGENTGWTRGDADSEPGSDARRCVDTRVWRRRLRESSSRGNFPPCDHGLSPTCVVPTRVCLLLSSSPSSLCPSSCVVPTPLRLTARSSCSRLAWAFHPPRGPPLSLRRVATFLESVCQLPSHSPLRPRKPAFETTYRLEQFATVGQSS